MVPHSLTALVVPRKCGAMRIVFMGSPDFAVPSLNALVEAGHEVVAVYAQPPRPAGRGKGRAQDRSPRAGGGARDRGADAADAARSRGTGNGFERWMPTSRVVAAYGLILPEPILEAPKAGCINVHASLLPRWRGAAPIQRAILAGDEVSGVTIMRMDEGLDTGPMLLKRELDIHGKNAGQVTEEMAQTRRAGADRVA